MGEKLLKLIKSEGLTSSRLAEILGTGASNISHIISGRSKPGYDLLRKILLSFPRINPDWLLLDAEEMYRAENSAPADSISDDLFAERMTVPATPRKTTQEDLASENPVSADDSKPIDSGFLRNLTSSTILRVIIVYSDSTFESFTPRRE